MSLLFGSRNRVSAVPLTAGKADPEAEGEGDGAGQQFFLPALSRAFCAASAQPAEANHSVLVPAGKEPSSPSLFQSQGSSGTQRLHTLLASHGLEPHLDSGSSHLPVPQNCFRNVSCFLGRREDWGGGEKGWKYYFSVLLRSMRRRDEGSHYHH